MYYMLLLVKLQAVSTHLCILFDDGSHNVARYSTQVGYGIFVLTPAALISLLTTTAQIRPLPICHSTPVSTIGIPSYPRIFSEIYFITL